MTDQRVPRPWRRKHIRLRGYDYCQPGAYYVTICTEHRRNLLGTVIDGVMHCNAIGELVHDHWQSLPTTFAGVALDTMILMPDHLHGIILLGTDPNVDILPSLGTVVGDFKGRSTTHYRQEAATHGWPPLVEGRLWQKRYNDRIVRNDVELGHIQDYIESNPYRWTQRERGNPV